MTVDCGGQECALRALLDDAEATIAALMSSQVDAVLDVRSQTPILLSKAQDALRESEERYRRIVETSSEAILTIDMHAVITFANQPLGEMLGHPAEQLVGRRIVDVLPRVTVGDPSVLFEPAQSGSSHAIEIGFVRDDGAALYVSLKTSPIRTPEGRCLGTLAMMTDRTRQQQDEDALRASEAQYRQIVEATTDGILKIDLASHVVFANRRFGDMLGCAPQDLIGASIFEFMSPHARDVAVAAMAPGATKVDSIDTEFLHRDGTTIRVNVAGTKLVDREGQPIGYLGVVRDITERSRLLSQLMISDRMASLGTLAAGVAHEINNPLAAVIGNLEFAIEQLGAQATTPLGDAALRDELRGPLDDAREAAQRVRFIVRDLKIFSRSPSEDPVGPVVVRDIMESSLRMAWNEIRHRAKLVKVWGDIPCVVANEARLGQVFLNLIVNAAQAVPQGRAEHNEIRVATRLDGDHVLIEISDSGPGIAPAIIKRIFDAFFTTKAIGVGSGLGLAICQRIVNDMGGTLTVESVLGHGATFRVRLPVSRSERTVAESRPPVAAARALRRGKILIIDDDLPVAQAAARMLGREHDIVLSVAAPEALARCIAGQRFDVVLCDLMMPDMTGMELYRELAAVVPEQAERMMFMTGGAFTPEARKFLATTPLPCFEKPLDRARLLALVRQRIRD